jgi:hypothetical protein
MAEIIKFPVRRRSVDGAAGSASARVLVSAPEDMRRLKDLLVELMEAPQDGRSHADGRTK